MLLEAITFDPTIGFSILYTSKVEPRKGQNYQRQQGGWQPFKVHQKPKGHFSSINAPGPLFLQKTKELLGNFWRILSLLTLISLPNTSKHIKTPSNSLNSHMFSSIFKVVFFHPIFLSFVPYLGFEVQRCGCSFLATIHTPFSLQLFLASFCLIKCFYCFFQHVLASQPIFIVFIACFLDYAMIYRFDVVFLAFLSQDMSKFHVCAQIHMTSGSLPCYCLDLHAYAFFALFFSQIYMLVLRSMSLCLDLCVYVLRAMLVCLDLCQLLCHVLLQPFLSLDISLSCVLALIGGVQIQILWSRPTSTCLGLC